jgi:hypothetical protein
MISFREDREQASASRMMFNVAKNACAATNDRRSGVPCKLFYSFIVVSFLTGHVVIEKSRTLSSPVAASVASWRASI